MLSHRIGAFLFGSSCLASPLALAQSPRDARQHAHRELARDVRIGDKNSGGFRVLSIGGRPLTTGGGLYIIASCTGLDDHVTNIMSLSGTGRLEAGGANGATSPCGSPAYQVTVQGRNPLTVTYRVNGFTAPVGIVNFTLDLAKEWSPDFGFLHAGRAIEEGCANDWLPMDPQKTKVAAIRAPCIIPHDVGAVGVARQKPRLFAGVQAFLAGPDLRLDVAIRRLTIRDAEGRLVDAKDAPFSSDFGIYNHPGTHAFGSAFYGVPPGYSIELTQTLTIRRSSPATP